jgi:hypothetical protein
VEVHRKHRNNATNAAKEERRCGAARRHETLVETQAPDHTATTAPRKKGDHHSPMKHSKRRMLGTYGQGLWPSPHLLKAGLPVYYRVEQQEERARRTEMRKEPAPIQRRDAIQSGLGGEPRETEEMSDTAMG